MIVREQHKESGYDGLVGFRSKEGRLRWKKRNVAQNAAPKPKAEPRSQVDWLNGLKLERVG